MQLNSFLKRAAFAIRFGDLNILISDLITPNSRMMFVRDIQARGQQGSRRSSAWTAIPIPSSSNGDIDWVQDAYTPPGTTRTHRTPTRACAFPTAG